MELTNRQAFKLMSEEDKRTLINEKLKVEGFRSAGKYMGIVGIARVVWWFIHPPFLAVGPLWIYGWISIFLFLLVWVMFRVLYPMLMLWSYDNGYLSAEEILLF